MGPPGEDGVSPEAMIVVNSGVVSVDEPVSISGSGVLPGEPVTLVLVFDINISFVVGGRTAAQPVPISFVVGGRTAAQPVANDSGAFTLSGTLVEGEAAAECAAPVRPSAWGVYNVLAEGSEGSQATGPLALYYN